MKLLMVALVFVSLARADEWADFSPRDVTRYGCVAQGTNDGHWYAHAYANQSQQDRCEDRFGPKADLNAPCGYIRLLSARTKRDASLKDCSQWMKQAEQRMKRLKKLGAGITSGGRTGTVVPSPSDYGQK